MRPTESRGTGHVNGQRANWPTARAVPLRPLSIPLPLPPPIISYIDDQRHVLCVSSAQSKRQATNEFRFAANWAAARQREGAARKGKNWLTDWLIDSVCVCVPCVLCMRQMCEIICATASSFYKDLYSSIERGVSRGAEKSSLERYGHSFDVLCRNRKQLQKSPFSPTNETEINKKAKTIQTTKLAIGICIKCATYTVLHNWGQEVLQRKPYREDRYTQRSSTWRFTIEA